MEKQIADLIAEMAFRVRLFSESSGKYFVIDNLGERDLTFLEYLDRRGEVGFAEVAAFFNRVSASTVSNTLKKLFVQGLIHRQDDPEDLRAKRFQISAKGKQKLAKVRDTRSVIYHTIEDNLQLSLQENRMLKEVMRRFIKNIDTTLDFTQSSTTEGGGS